MGFDGGIYINPNKSGVGTYTKVIALSREVDRPENGIVAGGIVMDWGPDGEIFEMTADEFFDNAEELTGYPYYDVHNTLFRELFKNASKFVGYKLNSGSTKATNSSIGEAKNSGEVGNDVTVTCYKNVGDESKYDVSTYYKGIIRDVQTVPEKTEDTVSVVLGTKTPQTLSGDLEKVTVDFSVEDNKIIAKVTGLPDDYTLTSRLYVGSAIASIMPDRINKVEDKDTVTWSFTPKAGFVATYKLEIRAKKDSYTTLADSTFTLKLNEADIKGADSDKLEDNKFVSFTKGIVIPENIGYVLEGGKTDRTVTQGDHNDFLNALSGYTFNILYLDSNNDALKELYSEYTRRMNEEEGYYFQTVVPNYRADYEGVISIYNLVTPTDYTNNTSLVVYCAGEQSACPLSSELTSSKYFGELGIVPVPDALKEILKNQGHFLYHQVGRDEFYSYIDVNTLTSLTDTKSEILQDNKTMRIINYIFNTLVYNFNRSHIGKTYNTPTGRAFLFNDINQLLTRLQDENCITDYLSDNLTVSPVPTDLYAVECLWDFKIVNTIRRIFLGATVKM